MARLPDLIEFAQTHHIKIGTISDLIQYRSRTEKIVERIGARAMQTPYGTFDSVIYRDKPTGRAHLALIKGMPRPERETLVRVHEPLSALDLLEVSRTSHSWSVPAALEAIAAAEDGVMVLLNCGATPDQFFNQFSALDTKHTRPQPTLDLRTFGTGAQILKDVGVGKMRLLASPLRMPSMTSFDLHVTGYQSMLEGSS